MSLEAHHGGKMSKEGRPSIEETIIEEALTEKELETLLIGFLEALEREQRPELGDKAS
jgi:hypothetical protein